MKFEKILYWLLISISIFFLLWRIFGNSPTGDMIIYPLVIAVLVEMAILKTKLDNLGKQFSSLAKDFKEHLKQ